MKYTSIKRHLKAYSIYGGRKTTINHAFASSISPNDDFDETRIKEAIRQLGQNPESELECIYCGKEAETWDHVIATVEKGEFSGAGHRVGNLLPCCKQCNSKKGNKSWEAYMNHIKLPEDERLKRKGIIHDYLERFFKRELPPVKCPEYAELISIRDQVLELMKKGDQIAESIRLKTKGANDEHSQRR